MQRQPIGKTLQLRVDRARELNAARTAEICTEVMIELEHVAEVLRAGESQAAIHIERHVLVQDLSTGIGKIVRINPDGTIPKDNPFVGKAGTNEAIWS